MPAEQFVGMRLGVDNAAYLNKMRASTQSTESLARSVKDLDRELRSLDRRDIAIRATLTGPSAVEVARLKETHRAITDLRALGDTQLRVGLSAPSQGQLARLGELRNQPELNAAVAAARWSTYGDTGQRVLSRKDPRVSALVAAALAVHGLSTPAPARGGWMVGL